MSHEELAEVLAKVLKKRGAVLRGDFVLSSGRRSSVYIDMRRLLGDESSYSVALDLLLEVGGQDLARSSAVIGVATGGLPWAAMLALRLSKPLGYVRPERKGHGTLSQVEGDPPKGRVVVVDDVATTGTSIAKSIEVLRSNGYTVGTALVLVDRGEGAGELLARMGVRLVSVATLKTILEKLGWGGE
ncbi:orotate phosphoribosyltransferase [Aeropyrum pernix K1]|uniref:Orotate phosphoribosyltransferase n=1 Tax=Aeropyrum pernix (strain ATCC 700893 / DSM 11879 / JCM 9820 / NBRC 100138 / K1) TaxID=272557 RepID=PYRE_AERPE|nr:orotate phosphoribosyltransferase [Aeropyrum pernix]Q9Y9D8.2 RecName: Full=Orotate phosphoribosyltransferase; Short=OPRT; Short=OPRTase [Aeropyrum pernix K1]BAA81362.2 orotate phosphoribosyltransferase [Aeropyrum pernix K1]